MSSTQSQLEEVITLYRQHLNPGLANLMRFGGYAALETRAEGALIYDGQGREYIDCLGGYGVFALGHRHPRVIEAVREQLDRLPLSTRTFFSEPVARLAQRLAELSPGRLQYVFFCHSGAEAVEGALKAGRIASGKPGVISATGAFHGKTFGALSASGREVFRKPFEPLLPGFIHIPFGDADALEQAITPEVGTVILEPIQGEGGVIVPPEDYLPRVREICNRHKLLLILDEVQTGLGRTGKLFASEWWGVEPDILCLAKALGGGVEPLGAFLATPEVWEKFFGENPTLHTTTITSLLAIRAGLATLEVLTEEQIPERAKTLGGKFQDFLRKVQAEHPQMIREVRGRGLLIGVEMAHPDIALLVIGGLVNRGVVAAYTFNNPQVIRFEPPLIIPEDLLQRAGEAFAEAVEEAETLLKITNLTQWEKE